MTLTCNLSQTGLLFDFNAKKASLNSFLYRGLPTMEVVIFGRYDSKFVLLDGILAVSLDPTLIK